MKRYFTNRHDVHKLASGDNFIHVHVVLPALCRELPQLDMGDCGRLRSWNRQRVSDGDFVGRPVH